MILVTGAGGFLGHAVARALVARGETVRHLSRRAYPKLDRLGCHQVVGDVADATACLAAVRGCSAVVHSAARAAAGGPREAFQRANVVGTTNLLDASQQSGVRRFVFTSTPSVVHAGGDVSGAGESAPYARHFTADYPRTKAEAEQLVLAANGRALATVALRPHLIWGPGDRHLLPRLLERSRAGRLRRVGRGPAVVDACFIDNAADAHLLALDRLAPGSPVAGKAYFIANGEPEPLWTLIDKLLAAMGEPPVTKSIPAWAAYTAGALCEAWWSVSRRTDEPPMTRFVARQLSTSHWYDLSRAVNELKYRPRVSTAEGLARLRMHFARHGTLRLPEEADDP